jgi:hypothetical protein
MIFYLKMAILRKGLFEANFGTQTFYDEFQGVQWDRLMVMLKHCNLVSFTEFDNDATRLFINTVGCAGINQLTNDEIRPLMFNLFSDGTLDEDERAIITVMNCLPACRVVQLLFMADMSVEDFDEVDGPEWDELVQIFLNVIS